MLFYQFDKEGVLFFRPRPLEFFRSIILSRHPADYFQRTHLLQSTGHLILLTSLISVKQRPEILDQSMQAKDFAAMIVGALKPIRGQEEPDGTLVLGKKDAMYYIVFLMFVSLARYN